MKYSTSRKMTAISYIPAVIFVLLFGIAFVVFNFLTEEQSIGLLIFGIALIAFGIIGLVIIIRNLKNKKSRALMKNKGLATEIERKSKKIDDPDKKVTYYVGWCGKFNQSFRMEFENHDIALEANLKKFSLFGSSQYEFVNHLTNTSEMHLIGKAITNRVNNVSLSSYFKYDKVNVLEYLESNGYTISISKFGIAHPEYKILKGDNEICHLKFKVLAPKKGEPGIYKSSNVILETTKKYTDVAFICAILMFRCNQSVASM